MILYKNNIFLLSPIRDFLVNNWCINSTRLEGSENAHIVILVVIYIRYWVVKYGGMEMWGFAAYL